MEEMSNVFLFTLFSPPLIFTQVAASISHFLTAATKFSCCICNKKCLLYFLSLALGLCRSFSRWASGPVAYFLFFSVFLFLYVPNLWTWLLTRMQKQFPLSVFVFIDSWVVSASQDAVGYAISRQNNLELHLGCHTCWLSYFTLVRLWGVRTGGRSDVRSRDYQNFSDG